MPNLPRKHNLHQALKRGWGIAEAKGHYKPLIQTKVCTKGFLLSTVRVHCDLPITLHEVQCLESLCLSQLIQRVINM